MLAGAMLLAGCGSSGSKASPSSASGGTATDTATTGGLLAPPGPLDNGDTVNGIKCETSEQLAYHIHAHLAVYVDGKSRVIPGDIGIFDNSCIYWLHTHDMSGIIHVESPDERVYTLGDFFAVWRQPLSATQVGPAKGAVTAYVDGKRYTGDITKIPLKVQAVIQLDVGSDSPGPQAFTFPEGL